MHVIDRYRIQQEQMAVEKPSIRTMHTCIEPGARVRYRPTFAGMKPLRATVIAAGPLPRSWRIQPDHDSLERTVPVSNLELIG